MLDTAGYGAVTITKSVSIVNQEGVEAGVTVTSGNAITVSTAASDVVNLRGLALVGSGGVGTRGVLFSDLGALNIQNCVIRGFVGNGLDLLPAGAAAFNVSDTVVSGSGVTGIEVGPSGAGTVTAAFNRVQVIGSGFNGFRVVGQSSTGAFNVTIANSAATNNGVGIQAESDTGKALTEVMVSNTVVSNNGTGVAENGANSQIYLAKNTIAGNSTGFNNGALFSFGDNYIKGNSVDGGAISLVATK